MPVPVFQHALDQLNRVKTTYNLDISGVAGFFGGNVAVAAMGTVHIYRGRRWLGWYNSPGSYEIAQSYGVLCRSRLWDGLYPGVNVDPASLFELDGKQGPGFRGIHSGTVLTKTGHLGYLLMEECKDIPVTHTAQGRQSSTATVTVVNLPDLSYENELQPSLSQEYSTYLASIPIIVTMLSAVMCVVIAGDWFGFSLILYGAFASGVSCLVIGSGVLEMTHPKPAKGAPRGDGVLGAEGSDLVVLLGQEGSINIITRGAFTLKFQGEPQYHLIGVCTLLLTVQFIAQLLIIPVATLFAQLMFLLSLATSWAYTAYLSSIDRESLQRRIVNDKILNNPLKPKYKFGTRTATTVFVLRVLREQFKSSDDSNAAAALQKVLNELIPNDTPDWITWKNIVIPHIVRRDDDLFSSSREVGEKGPIGSSLLDKLLADADDALATYKHHRGQSGGGTYTDPYHANDSTLTLFRRSGPPVV